MHHETFNDFTLIQKKIFKIDVFCWNEITINKMHDIREIEWKKVECFHIFSNFENIMKNCKKNDVIKKREILSRERNKMKIANFVTISYSLYVIFVLLQILIINNVFYKIFRKDKFFRFFSMQSKTIRIQILQRLCNSIIVNDIDFCDLILFSPWTK